jgi:hypothetical protein
VVPPPPRRYFGRKIFYFNGLQGVCTCKILITGGLRLKYLFSTGWPVFSDRYRRAVCFLSTVLSIAGWGELKCQLYLVLFQLFMPFRGLTCAFRAKTGKENCKDHKQKRIGWGEESVGVAMISWDSRETVMIWPIRRRM